MQIIALMVLLVSTFMTAMGTIYLRQLREMHYLISSFYVNFFGFCVFGTIMVIMIPNPFEIYNKLSSLSYSLLLLSSFMSLIGHAAK
jgi:drug/metabolite transporter (DMT)-like permease